MHPEKKLIIEIIHFVFLYFDEANCALSFLISQNSNVPLVFILAAAATKEGC